MNYARVSLVAGVLLSGPWSARADESALLRSEVAQVKKTLAAAEAALGVPAGYTRTEESFSLPTEGPGKTAAGKWYPLSSSVSLRFGDKGAKDAEADLKKAGEDFQKKIAAATEAGDYEEVSRLSVEYSERATKSQGKLMGGQKEPVDAHIDFNNGVSTAVDPDGVVLEKPGVIALRRTRGEEGSGKVEVMLYLDPVALKNTQEASSIAVSPPADGLDRKLGIYTITVRLDGPEAAVLAWVKSVNTGALLGIIRGGPPAAKPAK